MSTADKTKTISVNAFTGGLYACFATPYRWIASVFSRRSGSRHGNDLQDLNAHQLRDLGMGSHADAFISRQEKLEQARLTTLMMLMGMNGR